MVARNSGIPDAEGFCKARWCAGCAKKHEGAVSSHKKACEDCGTTAKELAYGLRACPSTTPGAPAAFRGSVCPVLAPRLTGLWPPAGSDAKYRWCSGCAAGHSGAVYKKPHACETCQMKRAKVLARRRRAAAAQFFLTEYRYSTIFRQNS